MSNTLSFTFDDGPDETWTPQILRELYRCHIVATFFTVGERVLAQPDLVREVLVAGHDIQLHCHHHIRHTDLTETELRHDCEAGLAALESAGVRPRLWRTPWGVCTDATHRVAERFGLRLVRWSIDTHDWRGDEPRAMLDDARPQLADGGAVLMHDALGPGASRAGCQNTVALLPALAAAARAHSLRLAPMGTRAHASAPATRELTTGVSALEHTVAELAHPGDDHPLLDPAVLAVECRVALYECSLLISGQAARVCGSRALIGASTLDRARRDLDLFLLQHRLDPKIAQLGAEMFDPEHP